MMTKSKFKLACECPTKLYYVDKPHYANLQAEDSFLKALAEGGYQVEALARCYYPDGQQVETIDNETALEASKRLLQKDTITLFEATIQYQQYLVRTDILVKNKNHLKIIEVKSKSFDKKALDSIVKRDGTINSKWKPYIADVAFQKWVLSHALSNIKLSHVGR